MMKPFKPSLLWGFLISIAASAVILFSLPSDEARLGFYRVDGLLQRETGLREVIANQCSQLTARDGDPVEKLFLDRYAPRSPRDSGQPCTLIIESASRTRFLLRTYWHYLVQIQANGKAVFQRDYPVEAPRPLALLPLAVLLLALIFEYASWGIGWTMVALVFTFSGLNLIAATRLALTSLELSFSVDQTLTGYWLIAAWLALVMAHRESMPAASKPASRRDKWGNRLVNAVIGLWNPGVYTIAGQFLFPIKQSLARALPFLDTQLVLIGLSLYLFSMDTHNWKEFLSTGIWLPRYFTYTVLLFTAVSSWSLRARRQVLIWQRPGIWRAILALALVEGLATQVPWLKTLPTITRFGGAVLASELAWPLHIEWRKAGETWLVWAGVILLASFATSLSVTSGALDLVLVITEPRIHPVGLVFFTFLAGIALGFVSGNFSAAFFSLFALTVKSDGMPLVRAALLDGVFAGMMLSPFSLYNLLPAAQFSLGYQELLKFRFKQLLYPLGIGCLIYAVSAVNSVAILRPATFVFLCLAALAFQLRKSYWQIGQHTFSLDARQAPR